MHPRRVFFGDGSKCQLFRKGVGLKAGMEQPHAEQLPNPLAVLHVALFAPGVLDMPCIDQERLEAVRLEQHEKVLPVKPRAFHGNGLDTVLLQVGAQAVEVLGEDAELPDGVLALPHANPVASTAYVNAGSVWMY